jgi:hypothetical protein
VVTAKVQKAFLCLHFCTNQQLHISVTSGGYKMKQGVKGTGASEAYTWISDSCSLKQH